MTKARAFATLLCVSFALTGVAAIAEDRGAAVTLDFTPIGEQAVAGGSSAAPADINFGVYPLSVLGIENAIRNADSRVSDYARGIVRVDDGPIAYSVVAIRDWERRYPHDPWIAKDLLALARFYAHVGTRDCNERAALVVAWLRHDYPVTAYANGAARVLAQLSGAEEARPEARPAEPPRAEPPHVDAPVVAAIPAIPAAPRVRKVYEPSLGEQGRVASNVPQTQATLPPYAHWATREP